MQINAFEARSILARERKAKLVLTWIMLRYFIDYPWRNKTRRDRRLTGGQALMGGLLTALRQRGIPLWLNASLQSLEIENGRVTACAVAARGREDHRRRAAWRAAGCRRLRAQPGHARAAPAATHRPGLVGRAARVQHR
jgi:3-oxosteroid 1-dehydrogenase